MEPNFPPLAKMPGFVTPPIPVSKPLPIYPAILRDGPGICLSIPQAMQREAQWLAQERHRLNANRRASADLGSDQANIAADTAGLLGELALLRALEHEGYRPVYTLLDTRPVSQADFRLNGIRYEIKTSPGKPYVSLNSRQHRAHRCDFYCFVRLITHNMIEVAKPIPHAAVDAWEERSGHSLYRSHAFDRLESLQDFDDFDLQAGRA